MGGERAIGSYPANMHQNLVKGSARAVTTPPWWSPRYRRHRNCDSRAPTTELERCRRIHRDTGHNAATAPARGSSAEPQAGHGSDQALTGTQYSMGRTGQVQWAVPTRPW